MNYNISITKTQYSKLKQLDFNNIPLGSSFTDHMFICQYQDGQWQHPKITPLQPIATHPATMAFHYGQAIFEGMKAYKNQEGTPLLFRPEHNAARLNKSAQRMGMPSISEDLFIEGLKTLVAIDNAWIPPQEGSALYLRPFMYATEAFIGMRAASTYNFVIMASPAGPYFSNHIKLWAEKQFIRAASGGTGEAKAAGNYAAAIRPTELAKAKGYDQVLWLDAAAHKYIQEVGTMNIFFKINGEFITPELDGSVLHGITRLSVIELLRHMNFKVTERRITINEISEAAHNGSLEEAFGTGTAVGIAYIKEISYQDQTINISTHSPVAQNINQQLNAIKIGKQDDSLNWMTPVITIV